MTQPPNLSVLRNLKIALFHLGSGMSDVITTGVWNRIMITDLGFSATPIGFLVALRYFLAPLGVWAGRMSDQRSVLGYRRLFWVWLGRAMMAISIFMLGLVTANLVRHADFAGSSDGGEWVVILVALLLFSLGSAISGSTFLALIYDRSGENQRGRAVGIVWTFLLLGFTIGGVLFGTMLPSREVHEGGEVVMASTLPFSADDVESLFLGAAAVMAGLWFFSLLGEEKRSSGAVTGDAGSEHATSLSADLKLAWSNRTTRLFFWFLGLSMLFAFSQDLILEPFAGEVFGMDARITTRFAAYWGSMSILATVVFLFLGRRFKNTITNTRMSTWGVWVLVATFALFALSSFAGMRGLVTPGLIMLGIGLGIWNVGTLGLMMEMSPFGRAGTFLGFWTLVVTLARGMGVSGGGVMLDVARAISGVPSVAYGAVFVIGACGLFVSLLALRQINVRSFKEQYGMVDATPRQVLASSMD
jgi:BCD family chlorophyll transporter-like MFS transporter